MVFHLGLLPSFDWAPDPWNLCAMESLQDEQLAEIREESRVKIKCHNMTLDGPKKSLEKCPFASNSASAVLSTHLCVNQACH